MRFCAWNKDLRKVTCIQKPLLGHTSPRNKTTLQQGNNNTNSSKGHFKLSHFRTALYFAAISILF